MVEESKILTLQISASYLPKQNTPFCYSVSFEYMLSYSNFLLSPSSRIWVRAGGKEGFTWLPWGEGQQSKHMGLCLVLPILGPFLSKVLFPVSLVIWPPGSWYSLVCTSCWLSPTSAFTYTVDLLWGLPETSIQSLPQQLCLSLVCVKHYLPLLH